MGLTLWKIDQNGEEAASGCASFAILWPDFACIQALQGLKERAGTGFSVPITGLCFAGIETFQ